MRMICTGTIIVVMSRAYTTPLSPKLMRAIAYAARVPKPAVISTASAEMTMLLTTYAESPAFQAWA
jgi:hypothetical protein